MAMTYLTKLKPEPMGAHSLATAYGVNSLVMSGDGAAAYISVKDVPAGTPLTNTEYWKIHTDLTAVKQSAEDAAQKANAARNEMLEIARSLTDMVEKSGNPVQAELVGGLPFDRVATALSPIQSGSGDPSPSNIRTISGWTGAKLTRCGKNLMNLTFPPEFTIIHNADGTITATNNTGGDISGARCELTGVLPAGTYTISKNDTNADVFLQTSETDYSNNITTYTFVYDGVSYLRVLCSNIKAGASVTYKIQLEKGSTATAYEPYQGDTYSADFGQTVYGGTLDWQTGVLTVDRAMVTLTGTESPVERNTTENAQYIRYNYFGLTPSAIPEGAFCSHFKTRLNTDVGDQLTNTFEIHSSNLYPIFRVSASLYPTNEAWKSYLSAQHAAGTPVQVCYKLATPQTIQLTPQEIKQLQGMNTLYGDGSISMIGRADKALALEVRIAALEAAG